MTEDLIKHRAMSTVTITVPIHGPKLSTSDIIHMLKDYMDNQHCVIHIDIAPNVSLFSYCKIATFIYMYVYTLYVCHVQVMWQLDTALFSMLIQGGISDNQGLVWRLHPSQMCAIEVTITKQVQACA